MSYQVLARKWRPRTFAELVGQEHVVRPLSNALNNDRVHHAFLFTGTRGVGKTTIARIFAKSLNCERGVSASPCGECSACQEINEGRFIDLIEVDAASRTRVEDTRELLDNVQYTPTRGRYKVYLVDEVHMLSSHSFNALLKTLEEPPPHVKFLLATTDPQRLPVTILSRCLQFNLKRLAPAVIADYLTTILDQEAVEYEPAAVQLIARAGEGSMRDALSLLDQAIAFGGNRVNQADTSVMLGSVDQQHVIRLLQALVNKDVDHLLATIAELDQQSPDYDSILVELLAYLQRIALLQMAPKTTFDDGRFDENMIRDLSTQLTAEDVQLCYQIALIGRRDLPLAADARGGFEMLMLRMLCFLPASADPVTPAGPATVAAPAAKNVVTTPAAPVAPKSAPAVSKKPPSAITTTTTQPPAAPTDIAHPLPATEPATDSLDWAQLVENIGLTALVKQLAVHCVVKRFEDHHLELLLDPKHQQVRTDNSIKRLQAALEKHFGHSLKMVVEIGEQAAVTPAQEQAQQQQQRRQEAVELIEQDPNIKAMQETFNARINPDSIIATDQ